MINNSDTRGTAKASTLFVGFLEGFLR